VFFFSAQIMTPSIPRTLPVQGYGQISQGYGAAPRLPQLDQPVAPVPELTPAGKFLIYCLFKYFFSLNFF